MAEIADRNILSEIQSEIAAARGQHECALIAGAQMISPSMSALMCSQHGIAVIAGLAQRRIGIGPQQHRIGTVDALEAQLTQRLGNDVGIGAHVGGQCQDRIAGALADAADAGGGVALEDRPVLGKGQQPRGVLGGLPVGIVGAALDVVDLLAVEFEGNAELDQRLDLALARQDAVAGSSDIAQMAGADGGQRDPPGPCTSTTRRPAR